MPHRAGLDSRRAQVSRAYPAIPRSAARRSDRRLAALSPPHEIAARLSRGPRPSSAVALPQLSSSALPAAARPPLATNRDHGTRPSLPDVAIITSPGGLTSTALDVAS